MLTGCLSYLYRYEPKQEQFPTTWLYRPLSCCDHLHFLTVRQYWFQFPEPVHTFFCQPGYGFMYSYEAMGQEQWLHHDNGLYCCLNWLNCPSFSMHTAGPCQNLVVYFLLGLLLSPYLVNPLRQLVAPQVATFFPIAILIYSREHMCTAQSLLPNWRKKPLQPAWPATYPIFAPIYIHVQLQCSYTHTSFLHVWNFFFNSVKQTLLFNGCG